LLSAGAGERMASPEPQPQGRGRVQRGRALVRRFEPVGVEPTFYSRHECKYIVDPAAIDELRHTIRPFVRPDDFARRADGYRYRICSLYLDSPDLALYHQTVSGAKDRFKLRIRSYSDDPAAPAYLEVKRKLDGIVAKRRAAVSRLHLDAACDGAEIGDVSLSAKTRADIEFFRFHMERVGARPVLRVRYLREAYQSEGSEPARITFDTELMHAMTLDRDVGFESGRWVPTPVGGVIVEIKFTERFPSWIQDCVRALALRQRAVPKYILSLDHLLVDGRCWPCCWRSCWASSSPGSTPGPTAASPTRDRSPSPWC
jgi:hypothetical protein